MKHDVTSYTVQHKFVMVSLGKMISFKCKVNSYVQLATRILINVHTLGKDDIATYIDQ